MIYDLNEEEAAAIDLMRKQKSPEGVAAWHEMLECRKKIRRMANTPEGVPVGHELVERMMAIAKEYSYSLPTIEMAKND